MFSRHDLVWLSASGWDGALVRAKPGQQDAIAQWKRNDWPLIVRRDEAGTPPGTVSLGLAMPPDAAGIKRRIALQVHESDIARTAPALALEEAARAAPGHWRTALEQLAGIPLQTYGSLALQALTGQSYLTAKSDIDLLFHPRTRSMLDTGLARIAQSAALLPLDGEIVFPSGEAVAWKEWAGAERVLVKEASGVRLAPVAQLLATLEDA